MPSTGRSEIIQLTKFSLHRSRIEEKYSFTPNRENSVTSMTHFWLGFSA